MNSPNFIGDIRMKKSLNEETDDSSLGGIILVDPNNRADNFHSK